MLQISGNDITLTRGDSFPSPGLIVPLYTNAERTTPYQVQSGDSVILQVRQMPVTGIGAEPEVVIDGSITINNDGQPVWYVSSEDSTIPAMTYSWDAQITLENGDVQTFTKGTLTILGENAIPEEDPISDEPGDLLVV